MSTINLSDRQLTLLNTIISFESMNRWPPSRRELVALVGQSERTVTGDLQALQKRGYIDRCEPNSNQYEVTEKGRDKVRESPIVPPSPIHDDGNIVCRYQYYPTAAAAEYHLIYSDGTCSCRHSEYCFHLRQAAEDLPNLIAQLITEGPVSEEHSWWSGMLIGRMERWIENHGKRILAWSKVPAPTYNDF